MSAHICLQTLKVRLALTDESPATKPLVDSSAPGPVERTLVVSKDDLSLSRATGVIAALQLRFTDDYCPEHVTVEFAPELSQGMVPDALLAILILFAPGQTKEEAAPELTQYGDLIDAWQTGALGKCPDRVRAQARRAQLMANCWQAITASTNGPLSNQTSIQRAARLFVLNGTMDDFTARQGYEFGLATMPTSFLWGLETESSSSVWSDDER